MTPASPVLMPVPLVRNLRAVRLSQLWFLVPIMWHSARYADAAFIVSDEEASPEADAADGGSDSPSPLLLEPPDPDAPPPDWNVARDPVPDMVSRSVRGEISRS